MNETIVKYGLPGIVIAGLAWFVMYLMKEHRKERKENMERANQQVDETNRVLRENSNILQGLKTLLENKK